jgi:DNA-binding NtrC family response regulator
VLRAASNIADEYGGKAKTFLKHDALFTRTSLDEGNVRELRNVVEQLVVIMCNKNHQLKT